MIKKAPLLLLITASMLVLNSKHSFAFCTGCVPIDTTLAVEMLENADKLQENLHESHLDTEIMEQQDFLSNAFYEEKVKPALQALTKQITAVVMQQTYTIGMFFDAKQQLETQRLYQELQVQAHKDYQPSKDFCSFGTTVRSLASSERNSQFNTLALNSRQMKRHLGNVNLASSASADTDKTARWEQFKITYCDPYDNGWDASATDPDETGLKKACGTGAAQKEKINIDIDYTRLIDQARTLDVTFHDEVVDDQEADVIAMGNNLFGHDIVSRVIDGGDVASSINDQTMYMALRSVAAKRNVAEHSFNSIVGMKSNGSAENDGNPVETRKFLAAVIKELGIDDKDDIASLIGEDPSYYAQLEILAKKIYQTPNFFAGLYDKPANVERKSVALKAIDLMLDRAIYESQLRQEMAMSVMLSTRLQPDIETGSAQFGGSR